MYIEIRILKKNNYYFFNLKITWFLVGYYSKILIIESFFSNKIIYFPILNLIIETILTVSYSFRIILVIENI